MKHSVNDILLALYTYHLMAFVERAFYELRPGETFHYGHHIRAICHHLEAVAKGDITRLLILMPPRHLKSHCASIAFPAWLLGRDPSLRIVTMSYGASLAEAMSRDSRRLIDSAWMRAVFPGLRLDPRKVSAEELLTTRNGGRIATSVGGALTGRGGDLLIIDDPMKADDVSSEARREANWNWFTGTAMSRLDNPKTGAIVVVAQRLHVDDLPGRLIQTGDWTVLELPAIETRHRDISLSSHVTWTRTPGDLLLPEHMGEVELQRQKRAMGSRLFAAQYQQSPTSAGGSIIQPEWFGTYPKPRALSDYEAVLQSWDTASVPGESNDYSACTTWGLIGNHIDLLDVHRGQHQYPELCTVARKLAKQWKPDLIIVESMDVGRSLKSDLRATTGCSVRGHTPTVGKVQRMATQSTKLEAGQVRLPKAAPWKEAFLAEVVPFPNGKHDDQVDSMSQALFALDCRVFELRHCSRYKG